MAVVFVAAIVVLAMQTFGSTSKSSIDRLLRRASTVTVPAADDQAGGTRHCITVPAGMRRDVLEGEIHTARPDASIVPTPPGLPGDTLCVVYGDHR